MHDARKDRWIQSGKHMIGTLPMLTPTGAARNGFEFHGHATSALETPVSSKSESEREFCEKAWAYGGRPGRILTKPKAAQSGNRITRKGS